MQRWPILKREHVVGRILVALEQRPRRAVLLRGPSGIGKTTVASHAADAAAAAGLVVAPIVALESLTHIPLGALAPLLSSSKFADSPTTADRYQALLAQLGLHSEGYLLVVDDAPLLDETSAAGLYHLIRVFGLRCILTARDTHPLTGSLARLLHEDLIEEMELDALSIDQCNSLLLDCLGGPVQPDSLRTMHESSHGNPMFLRELTMAAERSRALINGPHGFEIEPVRLPAHVVDGVSGRLGELEPAERELAEFIAVSQLWPRDLCDRAALDGLLDKDYAVLSTEEEHAFVRLAHPLYAESIQQSMTRQRYAEVARIAGLRLSSSTRPQDRFAGIALLGVVGGASPADLAWAASYAFAVGDHRAAVRIADAAADEPTPHFDAILAKASALSALGRIEAATEAFVAARDLAATDRETALVAVRWGQHLAYRLHDPAAASSLAGETIAQLEDENARALLRGDHAKWQLMAGEATAAALALEAPEGIDDAGLLGLAIGQAMMHTMAGRSGLAAAAVAAGRPLAANLVHLNPYAPSLLDLSEFLSLVARGRVSAAEEFAVHQQLAPFTEAAGMWSYALALVRQQRGDLSAALDHARLASTQLAWRDFTGLVGANQALVATILAQLGRTAEAEVTLAELAPTLLDDPKVILQSAEARAWILVQAGQTGEAAVVVNDAAGVGAASGHSFLAAITLGAALRFGEAAVVSGQLVSLAERADSEFMAALARCAAASAARDAVSLEAEAPSLLSVGLVTNAIAALDLAAEIHRAAGRSEAERRVRLASLAVRSTGGSAELAASARSRDLLSQREFSIANRAARRMRSKEIAAELSLSVRTVENHLASAYRKLGVAGREELAAALADAELPADGTTGISS